MCLRVCVVYVRGAACPCTNVYKSQFHILKHKCTQAVLKCAYVHTYVCDESVVGYESMTYLMRLNTCLNTHL